MNTAIPITFSDTKVPDARRHFVDTNRNALLTSIQHPITPGVCIELMTEDHHIRLGCVEMIKGSTVYGFILYAPGELDIPCVEPREVLQSNKNFAVDISFVIRGIVVDHVLERSPNSCFVYSRFYNYYQGTIHQLAAWDAPSR